MANEKVRAAARQAGVKLWELASECGVTDSTFSKQLRFDFSAEKERQVMAAINQIAVRKAARKGANINET